MLFNYSIKLNLNADADYLEKLAAHYSLPPIIYKYNVYYM